MAADGPVPEAIQMALESSAALRNLGAPLLVMTRRNTADLGANDTAAGPGEIQTVVWQHGGNSVNPNDIRACEDLLDAYYSQARFSPFLLLHPIHDSSYLHHTHIQPYSPPFSTGKAMLLILLVERWLAGVPLVQVALAMTALRFASKVNLTTMLKHVDSRH